MWIVALIGLVSATVALVPSAAGAVGDSARGRMIVETWCISCHWCPDRGGCGADAFRNSAAA